MTKQQDEYARKNRDLQEYQKAVNKAAKEAAKLIRDADPRYKDFGAIPMVVAHVRSPAGKNKALMRLVDLIMEDKTCEKTNTELLAKVQKEFSDTPLSASLWSQKRKGYFIKDIQKRINGNMQNPISVEGCKSLSDVRRRFKVAYLGNSRTITRKATFIFSKDAVVVNGKPHSFVRKSAKGKSYKIIRFKRDSITYEIRAKALAKLLSTTR